MARTDIRNDADSRPAKRGPSVRSTPPSPPLHLAATRARLSTTRAAEAYRPQVRALKRGAHERSVFGDIPFSDAKFDRAFDKTMSAPGQYLGLVVTLTTKRTEP